jgi:hypothetical protein
VFQFSYDPPFAIPFVRPSFPLGQGVNN